MGAAGYEELELKPGWVGAELGSCWVYRLLAKKLEAGCCWDSYPFLDPEK